MKTAFVTGATGFLGRHLVEQLQAKGYSVTCFHRETSDVSALKALGVTLAAGRLTDTEAVAKAIPKACDAVFHVAANTNTWSKKNAEQTKDNVDGTRAVVLAAVTQGAKRFVHTSTGGTWGHGNPVVDESSPQLAQHAWINYERTKWLAEQEVKTGIAQGLEAVIVNPPHIMGRYDTTSWARLIKLAHQGKLPGVPPGTGMFAHATDVSAAHIAAAEKGRVGELYLLPGAEGSFEDVVRIVCELSGREMKTKVMPAFAIKLLARLKAIGSAITGKEPDITPESAEIVCSHMTTRSTKAKDELGLQVRPLKESVKDSYDWLKAQGLLDKPV